MQAVWHDPCLFKLCILGGFRQSKRHLCRYQSILITWDKEDWLFDILHLINTLPSETKHHFLDRLNQSQETEERISHITNWCERVLNDNSFYVVITLLIEHCCHMDSHCTPKWSSYNKHSVIIDPAFFFAERDHCLCILNYTFLFGFTFTLRVPSICDCYYIHIEFVINELKIVESQPDIARIFMHKNHCVLISSVLFVVHEPSLQRGTILWLQPYFLILHTSFRWVLIAGWVIFNKLNWLPWHIKELLLPSVNHQQNTHCKNTEHPTRSHHAVNPSVLKNIWIDFVPLFYCHGTKFYWWCAPNQCFEPRPQEPVAIEWEKDVTCQLLEQGGWLLASLNCVGVWQLVIWVLCHLKFNSY